MRSNRITLLVCAAISALAFGCGGYEDQDNTGTDQDGDEVELGEAEQAINIGNGGYGFSTSNAHLSCAQPGVSGQSCWIPGEIGSSVRWCFAEPAGSPFSASEKTNLRAGIAKVDSLVNESFVEGANDGQCELQLNAANPGGGTTFLIDNYAAFIPLFPTNLTSPAGASHVNGTWKSFDTAQVIVGTQKLNTQLLGLTANALNHIGGHVAGLFLGLGTTTPASSSYMQRTFTATNPVIPLTLTTGEKCRSNARNETSPTTVSAVTGCGI